MKSLNKICLLFFTSMLSYGQIGPIQLSTSLLEAQVSTKGFIESNSSGEQSFIYGDDESEDKFGFGFSTSFIAGGIDIHGYSRASFNVKNEDVTNLQGAMINPSTGKPRLLIDIIDKIWKVNGADITRLRNSLSENGILSIEEIPEDILRWPGKSNPYLGGDSFINFEVAPFFDHDEDGVYNALFGDYPLADQNHPDFIPSEFAFQVLNDWTLDSLSNDKLVLEYKIMSYVLNCNDDQLSASINHDITITNYSGFDYQEFVFGLYSDSDLGCVNDDKIGSSPETNSFYTYNELGDDAFCPVGSIQISPNQKAISSWIFTNSALTSYMPIYNFNQAPGTQKPSSPNEMINYLNGKWKDGTPLTKGGNGYNTTSQNAVQYAYSDFPSTANGWIETSDFAEGKSIAASKHGTLMDRESIKFSISKLVTVIETESNSALYDSYVNNINTFKQKLQEAKEGEINCFTVSPLCSENCVWPGDLDLSGRVDGKDMVHFDYIQEVTDLGNPSEREVWSSEWKPWNSADWGNSIFGIEAKHADVTGNSYLNNGDLIALTENFNLINDNYIAQTNIVSDIDEDGFIMSVANEISGSPSASLFTRMTTVCIDIFDGVNFEDKSIYKLSYELRIDTNLILASPFDLNFELNSDGFEYLDLDDPTTLHLVHLDPIIDEIDISNTLYCRDFIVNENYNTTNLDGRDTTYLEVANVYAIDEEGNEITVGLKEKTPVILYNLNGTTSTNNSILSDISIFPNPAASSFNVKCDGCTSDMIISIYNIQGQYMNDVKQMNGIIDVSNLNNGVYIVRVKVNGKITTKKLILNN